MKKLVISLYFCTIISDYQIVVNLIAMIIKDKITENSCFADDLSKDFDVKIPEFGIKMSCSRVLQKGIALSCSASDIKQ